MDAHTIITELYTSLNARNRTIRRVFFIACGGSLAGIYPGFYLLDRESKSMNSRLYNSRELVLTPPMALDGETLVIACTLAGTPETLEALDYAKSKGAVTIAIFGQNYTYGGASVDYILHFKTIADTNTPMLETNVVVALQLGFSLLKVVEEYPYYQEAELAYTLLETMAKEVRTYVQSRARKFATQFAQTPFLYVLASRAAMGEAYAFVPLLTDGDSMDQQLSAQQCRVFSWFLRDSRQKHPDSAADRQWRESKGRRSGYCLSEENGGKLFPTGCKGAFHRHPSSSCEGVLSAHRL